MPSSFCRAPAVSSRQELEDDLLSLDSIGDDDDDDDDSGSLSFTKWNHDSLDISSLYTPMSPSKYEQRIECSSDYDSSWEFQASVSSSFTGSIRFGSVSVKTVASLAMDESFPFDAENKEWKSYEEEKEESTVVMYDSLEEFEKAHPPSPLWRRRGGRRPHPKPGSLPPPPILDDSQRLFKEYIQIRDASGRTDRRQQQRNQARASETKTPRSPVKKLLKKLGFSKKRNKRGTDTASN